MDVLIYGQVSDFLPQYGIAWQNSKSLFVSVIRDFRCSTLLAGWLRCLGTNEVEKIGFITGHRSLSNEVRRIFQTLDKGAAQQPSPYSKLTVHRLNDYMEGDHDGGSSKHTHKLLPPEGVRVSKLYLSVYTAHEPFDDIIFVPKLDEDTTTLADHTAISLGITTSQLPKQQGKQQSRNDNLSLVGYMNKCVTAGGRRRMKTTFIHHPLLSVDKIRSRQSLIRLFMAERFLKLKIQNLVLCHMVDFDMVSYQLCTSHNLLPFNKKKLVLIFPDIVQSIAKLQTLEAIFSGEPKFESSVSNFHNWLGQPLKKLNSDLCKLSELIQQVFSVEKLVEARQDNSVAILNPHLMPEAKELSNELESVQQRMDGLAEQLDYTIVPRGGRSNSIQKVKIVSYPSCGKVFRVPRAVDIPKNAILIRVNKAESLFTTTDMQILNGELDNIQKRMSELEVSFISKVLEISTTYLAPICRAADLLSQIDFCQSMASLVGFFSFGSEWIFADVNDPATSSASTVLAIQEGKHPLLELQSGLHGGTDMVVTNDLKMEAGGTQVLLITGPNMGGKSTFARQQALIALMSQWGCPVPARSVSLSPFAVFWTRIGAEDNPVQGMSTFMTEAVETAFLLKMVDKLAEKDKALLVIDELGRGTSSSDGLALSAAVLKKLSLTSSVFALFATHFHQLASLELTKVASYCTAKIQCFEIGNDSSLAPLQDQLLSGEKVSLSTFKVKPGVESDSDGILLAKIFGFPSEVINRALEISQINQRLKPTPFDVRPPAPERLNT